MKRTQAQTERTCKPAKRRSRKMRKKIIAVTLQTGTAITRTEIIRIKQMFTFLATAWLKNNGFLLTKKIIHKHLVKVLSFSRVKISCMTDDVKPTLQNINLDHILLQAGANDLGTENTVSQNVKAMVNPETSLKNDGNTNCVWHCSKAW